MLNFSPKLYSAIYTFSTIHQKCCIPPPLNFPPKQKFLDETLNTMHEQCCAYS